MSNKPSPVLASRLSRVQDMNFEPMLHYSEEIENAIIGGCMLFPDKILEVMGYARIPELFYFNTNRIIYSVMMDMVQKGRKIDLVTVPINVRQWCKAHPNEDIPYVMWSWECCQRIRDVVGNEHVMEWCLYLVQFYIKREQIRSAMSVFNYDDPLEANKQLSRAIEKATSFANMNDWSTVKDIMMQLAERRDKIKSGQTFGVKTGFHFLDWITGGGIEAGFHVICARPAMGKTAFALSLAMNIAEMGMPVGIISLEMPNVQLAARLLAQFSGIDFQTIFKGQNQSEGNVSDETEKWLDSQLNKSCELPMYITDAAQVNIHSIRYKATKLKREKGARVIFIDYLQLVELEDKKNEARYVAVGKLSRELKLLSKELDMPIIALAQLNRESEGSDKVSKPGRVSQLRESGSIEQDMDMGIVIDRPFKRGDITDINGNSTENIAFIDVQKHRNGAEKTIQIEFDPKTMRFFCPINGKRKQPELPMQTESVRIPRTTEAPNLEMPF